MKTKEQKQRVNCSRADAQEQIKLCLDALPLEERGFSTASIAHQIAEYLFLLTINQKALKHQ